MRTTDRLHSCLRKAEVSDLPFPNQFLDRSCHVFDRHVRVNTVLIKKINDLDPEPIQRSLSNLLDVLWPTVQPGLFAGIRITILT
jgi:hypothetical protein